MIINRRYSLIILLLLLLSCNNEKKKDQTNQSNPIVEKETRPVTRTLIIQPFEGFSKSLTDTLRSQLEEVFSKIVIKDETDLPASAYYEPRNRYRADSLLFFLWNQSTKKSIVLGLTNRDISITKGEIKDWGILGISSISGYAAVVSSYRLDKNKIHEYLYRITIHELGHAEGLYHCNREKWCIMRDYNGKNIVDELIDFCPFCKYHLREKGWRFD